MTFARGLISQPFLHCQASLETSQHIRAERRQVVELPPMKVEVIEHLIEHSRCHSCGRVTKGEFPKDVCSPVQYGPRLRACAVYLSQYQLLPYGRACEILSDWFGVNISQATLRRSIADCSKGLVKLEARIKNALRRADVLNVDETVLRVGRQLKYVQVTGTGSLAHYSFKEGEAKQP